MKAEIVALDNKIDFVKIPLGTTLDSGLEFTSVTFGLNNLYTEATEARIKLCAGDIFFYTGEIQKYVKQVKKQEKKIEERICTGWCAIGDWSSYNFDTECVKIQDCAPKNIAEAESLVNNLLLDVYDFNAR